MGIDTAQNVGYIISVKYDTTQPKGGGMRMINYAKLKGLMAERGLTVVELSHRLGVSRQSASDKVNGKAKISLTDAQTIAKALNMTKEERDLIFFPYFVKSEATK